MDTCQQCRQLKARIACLEAYLDSLGMPLPTAADAVGLRNLPPIEPPITETPKRRDTLRSHNALCDLETNSRRNNSVSLHPMKKSR